MLHGIFSRKQHTDPAVELFHLVNAADYVQIAKVYEKHPELMFKEVCDENGSKTTPFKRALYNLDTYTWLPFYENITHEPELLREFGKQLAEQEEHIHFGELLHAYGVKLHEDHGNLNQDATGSHEDLAEKQKTRLPDCMLKEICREGCSWHNWQKFDVTEFPRPKNPQVYADAEHKYFDVAAFKADPAFTVRLLVRGHEGKCAHLVFRQEYSEQMIKEDGEIFLHLFKARLHDLHQLRKQWNIKAPQPAFMREAQKSISSRSTSGL